MQKAALGAVRNLGEDGPIRFILSTDKVARDGNAIDCDGWELDHFRNNPVALWAHDDTALPIGRWENLSIEDVAPGVRALCGDLHFASKEYYFAATVERLYRSGAMNAVSVRWNPTEFRPLDDGTSGVLFTRSELLEVSAVPVPADPDAIVMASQRGLIDREDLDRLTWRATADAGIEVIMSEKIEIEETEERIKTAHEAKLEEVEPKEEAVEVEEPVADCCDDVECEDACDDVENDVDARSADPVELAPEADAVAAGDGEDGDDIADSDPARGVEDSEVRAGKKISKKRLAVIREAIKALDDAASALRGMVDEVDPEEEEEEEYAGRSVEDVDSETRAEDSADAAEEVGAALDTKGEDSSEDLEEGVREDSEIDEVEAEVLPDPEAEAEEVEELDDEGAHRAFADSLAQQLAELRQTRVAEGTK